MKSSRFLIMLGTLSLLSAPSISKSISLPFAPHQQTNVNIIKERCELALNEITLNVDQDQVVADFLLPVTGIYNTTLTWTSSNSNALNIVLVENDNGKAIRARAKVTRLEANTNLNLTVKATITGHEEDFAQKTFNLTVLKASAPVSEDLPAEFVEDFSDYDAGLDLGDYYAYKQSGSENFLATIVDQTDTNLSNINNMVSSKALRITSQRQSSDTRYTRKISITTQQAKNGAYLEGYYLFTGESNGVNFEFLNGTSIVAGLSFNPSGMHQYLSGAYTNLKDGYIKEGIWNRFRISFRASGYSFISLYNYATGEWEVVGSSFTGYFPGYGFSSGNKGDINGFRIVNQKGKNKGYSYISDLRLGLTASTDAEVNPNRTNGIGEITNFEKSVFINADEAETPDSMKVENFIVHNRFDDSDTYTFEQDYTISTTSTAIREEETEYRYLFTLLETGETKTLTQTVYTYHSADAGQLIKFKAGALKKVSAQSSKATITLTGSVNRNDGKLCYVVLKAGATKPSAAEIINKTALTDLVLSGEENITTREFALTTEELDVNQKYDVYALLVTTSGNSAIAESLDISTIVNISSCEDFYQMANDVDTAYSTFRLTADIDFADYYWNYDSNSFEFHGKLDGEGHTIRNLTISSTESRVALFPYCYGDISNITFENCQVYGADNVGLIGGNIYGGTYENLIFKDCVTSVEPTLTSAGEGYFGVLGGRCRGDGKIVTLKNVSIENMLVECPKYCGLLTGGVEKGVVCNIDNMYATGSVDTDGAAVGLIGRNRGNTTINNLVCFLNILNAKKEVGVVTGHNKEGAKLSVNNAILDLKIRMITQPGYFGSFIGSHDAATSSYSYKNVAYISEDYSDIAENITKDIKAYDVGNKIISPEDARGWEENTFIRDFNTNLFFQYDSIKNKPVLALRNESELSFTHDQFERYVDELVEDKPTQNHYYLIKAGNILAHLSNDELFKVDATKKSKYDKCLKDYQDLVTSLLAVVDEIGLGD